jgi:hypothetical protein
MAKRGSAKPPSQERSADQYRRFIETARALECDEDKERFEEKLKRIASAKAAPASKPKAPRE